MKIRPVGADLFHANGQADRRDETNSRLSQFCERAWKWGEMRDTLIWVGGWGEGASLFSQALAARPYM
jgi:hypothetical protein